MNHGAPNPSDAPDANAYASQTLDHHGLVAGMVDELDLVGKIDAMIPQDLEQRQVSVGMAVKAMILVGLGFMQRTLYLTPHFFKGKPVERLLGPGILAEHLNDDALGRALDAIYDFGVELFYYLLAVGVVKQLGLTGGGGHLDATSFHVVDGEYNSGDEAAAEGVVHIRPGYSRDHRPDLNQVVLRLVSESQAGIPLLMAPSSGNVNDQAGFRELIEGHIGQLKADVDLRYLVADSALYTENTLLELGDMAWISRVPETFGSARAVIDAVAEDLAASGEETVHRAVGMVEAGVRQRWLVVHSRAARERVAATLRKQHLKRGQSDQKAFHRLCQQRFACEPDAKAALDAFAKGLALTQVHGRVVQQAHHARKGRPEKRREPDLVHYAIEGQLASRIDVHARRLRRKSCFIVATNDLDGTVLDDAQVLDAYRKDQQKVERGFRFLKDPLFVASALFLKLPKRLMALMAVMTLCLMVYAALEHRLRQGLAQHAKTFPDQKGKPTERPTARWVFQFFGDIHVLVVAKVTEVVLNLNSHHRALLEVLGERYVALYANSG